MFSLLNAAAQLSNAKIIGIIAVAFLIGVSVGLLVYLKLFKKK